MKDTTASVVVVRFGRRIAAARRRLGWTVADLALKSGVARTIISNLEYGRQGCTLDSAVRVAAAAGVCLDGLEGPCGRCQDTPPAGFTCRACGASGEEPPP